MDILGTVLSSEPGQVRVRVPTAACEGCAGGCAGRCSPLADERGACWSLDTPDTFQPGQAVRIRVGEGALGQAAWRGYGLALLGMVVGAAAGHALGRLAGWPADPLALAGLLAGTFLPRLFPSDPRLSIEPVPPQAKTDPGGN